MTRLAREARGSWTALAAVFRNARVRRLQLAYLLSLLSVWSFGIASSVFAFKVGGAPLVGLLAVARMVPAAVASPLTAVAADRYSRQRVLLVSDGSRAALAVTAAAAIWIDLPPATVFALTGLMILVSTPYEPAKNALVPELTEDPAQLAAVNAVTNTFGSAATFLGPAAGGALLALTDVGTAFAVSAGGLLVAVVLLVRMGRDARPSPAESTGDGWREELSRGFGAVAESRTLRLLLGLTAVQCLVSGLLLVLLVVVALELVGMGDGGVGVLNAAVGLGAVLGGGAALALASARRLTPAYAAGLLLWGVPIGLLAAFDQPVAALVLLALVGVGDALSEVTSITLMQRAVPDELRGRVFGILEGIIWGSIGIGGALAPVLIELLGTRGALIATGALMPVVVALSWPLLSKLDADSPPPTAEIDLLRGVPFLALLDGPVLEGLAAEARRQPVPAGEVITRQGEPGEFFYVIDRGRVEVHEDGVRVREQGPGEFLGEIALLRPAPRTATVTALEDVELLTLGREQFVPAVTGHAESLDQAEAVIAARLGSARRSLATL